jgi:transposase InsO family protein
MRSIWRALGHLLSTGFRPRLSLQLEVVALRHQLCVYERSRPCRFLIEPGDRVLWSWLACLWPERRQGLRFVQPRAVLEWQKRRFRDHWRRKNHRGRPDRPAIDLEIRQLIRRISRASPSWGSPRIVGELAKIGIVVAKSTVVKYRIRTTGSPPPTWKTFLDNHVRDLVSTDFFVVPTVRFQILYVLVVLAHQRRRIVHFNVTEHPTAQWTAQQMVEAFPFDAAPRYPIRDRDGIYGQTFRRRLRSRGVEEALTAPRSPWQNPYAERVIGTLRRECLDNVIILHERHPRRILRSYIDFYHRWRVHRSLEMDSPGHRPVQPSERGNVIEFPDVGGLQRHYEPRAAQSDPNCRPHGLALRVTVYSCNRAIVAPRRGLLPVAQLAHDPVTARRHADSTHRASQFDNETPFVGFRDPQALYPRLETAANRWMEHLVDGCRYLAAPDPFLARGDEAGQTRPTPLVLCHGGSRVRSGRRHTLGVIFHDAQ